MKTKVLSLFLVFFFGIFSSLQAQDEFDPFAKKERNLEEDEDDNEIVNIQKDIRMQGRLKWNRFVIHPILGIGFSYNNNITEGTFVEDLNTGLVVRKKIGDGFFSVTPGGAVTYSSEYMPFSAGYKGDFNFFFNKNEFNTQEHNAFFLGKILQEYWSLSYEIAYNQYKQRGSANKTTDTFDLEALAESFVFKMSLPHFSIFRDNSLLVSFKNYDDLREGLDVHYQDYQAGFKTSLTEDLSIEALGGIEHRHYKIRTDLALEQFKDFLGFIGSLKVSWVFSEKATLSLEAKGYLEDDNFADSGYKYIQSYGIRYDRDLSRFLSMGLSYTLAQEIWARKNEDASTGLAFKKRVDYRHIFTIEMAYQVRTWAKVVMIYNPTIVESNIKEFNTVIHIVGVHLDLGL